MLQKIPTVPMFAVMLTACGTENAEDVKKLMDTESEYLLS